MLQCMIAYKFFCYFHVILRIYKFIGFMWQGFYLGEGFGVLTSKGVLTQNFLP